MTRYHGGIGRRARFRSWCPKGRGGSTPSGSTEMNPQKIRSCKKCNVKESYSKYCLKCRGEARKENDTGSRTIGHYRMKNGDVHPSWLMSEIRSHCRIVNRDRKQACQVCGYDFYVEHAHIRAVSEFPDDALVKDVNHPTNILLLCPNHHKEFDRSPEKRAQILSVVQLDRTSLS